MKDVHKDIHKYFDSEGDKIHELLEIFMAQSFSVKEAFEAWLEDKTPNNARIVYARLSNHTRTAQSVQREFYTRTHKQWHNR